MEAKLILIEHLNVFRAGFTVALCLNGIVNFVQDPEGRYGKHRYFDYVSNANEFFCAVWAVFTVFSRRIKSPELRFTEKWLTTQTMCSSYLIALVYWGLMETTSFDLHSLWQHGGLALVTSADYISQRPYKFKWILAPFIYCFLDCFYMFAIAMLWPETRDAVYKFATFGEFGSESMYDVLQLQFILTFVVQTTLFCILWSIQRTVWFLKDKFTPETSTTDSDTKLLKQ